MKRSRLTATAALATGVLALTAACSSNGGFSSPSSGAAAATAKPNHTPITLMFGSSGPAETKAVNAAATAFTKQSGIKVQVIAASNLSQQVAQGFAGNQPPDVFYLDPLTFQSYAKDGVLDPYAPTLPNAGGFAPALKAAFTYKGQFVCAPKDASTLALYINTKDWKLAGLGAPPANWSQLKADAKKLTTAGRTGLVIDQDESGIDEFLYQNGSPVSGDLVTVNTTGKYIQMNNGDGSDIDNTYISSFSPFTEPYSFALTPQLNTLIPKTQKAENPNNGVLSVPSASLVVGRGSVITDGKASFTYQFDNLNVDGQNIGFVSAPDSDNYRKMSNIDSVFETQPFQVNPGSKIVFSDWSGFSDSSAAAKVVGDSGYVGYRIEVVDNATGSLIGTIKNVEMTASTLHGMERNAYLLSTSGISGRQVRIRVTMETNLDSAKTALIKSYSFENTALNNQTQSVSMEPVTVIKSFALSQNYPNPFPEQDVREADHHTM